jgi:Protein of unknown function (DUF664)
MADPAPLNVDISRIAPNGRLDEREMLRSWLEFQRSTMMRKIDGLTPAQLRIRPVPSSPMSLLGLLRHHTEGEYGLFRECVSRVPVPPMYGAIGGEWDVDDVDPADAYRAWQEACAESRRIETAAESLDVECASVWGAPEGANLRWIMIHTIEEYARHNGHADLIRELVDGTTGF